MIRKERSIPEIQRAWTFVRRCDDRETWKETGQHLKHVYFQFDCIIMESDEYYSGRTFPSPDGETSAGAEFLVVHYFYGTERFAVDVVTGDESVEQMVEGLGGGMLFPGVFGGFVQVGYFGASNEETLVVINKIIHMWGLERLSNDPNV
jgi:hypothetical protein